MSESAQPGAGEEGEEGTHPPVKITKQGLLPLFPAASIQGPDAGSRLTRIGTLGASGASSTPSPLCAEADGFSLHVAVQVEGHDTERLEHLCRYIARPPLAAEH